ncbi:hypothetical protein MBANPS3_005685 [Mucor bainieri]
MNEIAIEMMSQQAGEDDSTVVNTTRTMDDNRIRRIVELSSTNATTLADLHHCQLCQNDDSIKEKRKPIYGHKAHAVHLFQSLVAPGWKKNKSNNRGQHTNTAHYIREHPVRTDKTGTTCSVCRRRFKGKHHVESAKRHLNEHADKKVEDLDVDQAKDLITDYFMDNFGVQWNAEEMDDLIRKR